MVGTLEYFVSDSQIMQSWVTGKWKSRTCHVNLGGKCGYLALWLRLVSLKSCAFRPHKDTAVAKRINALPHNSWHLIRVKILVQWLKPKACQTLHSRKWRKSSGSVQAAYYNGKAIAASTSSQKVIKYGTQHCWMMIVTITKSQHSAKPPLHWCRALAHEGNKLSVFPKCEFH